MGKLDLFLAMTTRLDPRVASVKETPPHIAKDIASRLPPDCETIVEFGGGSGAVTRELLRRMQNDPDGTRGALLHVFETNTFCSAMLSKNLEGAPVRLLDADARWAPKMFGKGRVDGIVSGIPYSRMKEFERRDAAIDAWLLLKPGGRFIVYQVRDSIRNAMEDIFGNVDEMLVENRCPLIDPKYIFVSEKRTEDLSEAENGSF